jgi:hypothetical protein
LISRRAVLLGSAGLVGASVLGVTEAAQAAVTRPTGPEYIRYEDLYRRGDSVGGALARLTEPKIVTFPEGRFACSDFNSGFQAGVTVPAICRGIVGSGKGTLGGSSGTMFTMTPNSSTKGNGARDSQGRLYVPVQGSSTPCQLNLLKQLNQAAPAVWRHFQVAGTDQGHIFSGFQVHNTAGQNVFEDILITGWDGNAGSPPGETSALAVNGRGRHRVTRVEVDGRRRIGGSTYGAMGMTFQRTVGASFDSCHVHHCRAACYVMFQSVNGTMVDCISDATVSNPIGNGGINLERTAGWTLAYPKIIGRPRRVHVTHSNDYWTLQRDGRSYSVADGSLKVVNPTYNDLWGDKLLYVQSWSPYWNGDSMRTSPLVTIHDWSTHKPYKWVHRMHQLIT